MPSDNAQDVRNKVILDSSLGFEGFIAAQGTIAIEKLRLVGLYDDRQPGFFMMRIRVPGGRLNADQVETLGRVVEKHVRRQDGASDSDNFAEITTRQDLQIHWIRIEEVPSIWKALAEVGLGSLLACGDSVRNITGCPLAGLLPDEVFDASGIVDELTNYFLDSPDAGVFLPRKFKVAVTGSVEDCVLSRINDLAFTPARHGASLGFNVWAGGGLSDYPRLASDLDMFVERQDVVDVVDACVRLFKKIGNFQDKAVNRFRRVVADYGPERIREELVAALGRGLLSAGESLLERSGDDHLGAHPQKGDGLNSFGINVLVGRITGPQLRELARLARTYGDGGIRLTQAQNAVLTGIPALNLRKLSVEPLLRQLDPFSGSPAAGVIACTSAPYCKFGIFDVKTRARELAAALESTDSPTRPFDFHISGCKASCAQPQVGDIGLRATAVLEGEREYIEAFDICAGGSLSDGRLGRWIAYGVPAKEIADGISRLQLEFVSKGGPGETFGGFVARRGWPLTSAQASRREIH